MSSLLTVCSCCCNTGSWERQLCEHYLLLYLQRSWKGETMETEVQGLKVSEISVESQIRRCCFGESFISPTNITNI